MGFRKRETERIERENHAFAKRLFDKQANLSKKKLDLEFKDHMKYKKQIQKVGSKKKGAFGKKGSLPGKVEESKRESEGAEPRAEDGEEEKEPVQVIEEKPEEKGEEITAAEGQVEGETKQEEATASQQPAEGAETAQ